MIKQLDDLIHHAEQQVQSAQPIPAVIIHPNCPMVLASASQAAELGIVTPILVGVRDKVQAAAEQASVDLTKFQFIEAAHSHDAIVKAASLVNEGKARLLVKGSVHTDELMGVLVAREQQMRTHRRMSHVFVMQVASYHKLLLITDAALNVIPDLTTKADIVQNAIDLAHRLGIAQPKVAILSAQENVKPQLPSTIDAAALCKMADRGQIIGGLLDGPLAFDNAINAEAAQIKGIVSAVAGDADILVAPDLEAGNMLSKQLMYLARAEAAGIVLGAKVPIVLTSRAEHESGRLYSLALGALIAR